jgi:hypothetical protein
LKNKLNFFYRSLSDDESNKISTKNLSTYHSNYSELTAETGGGEKEKNKTEQKKKFKSNLILMQITEDDKSQESLKNCVKTKFSNSKFKINENDDEEDSLSYKADSKSFLQNKPETKIIIENESSSTVKKNSLTSSSESPRKSILNLLEIKSSTNANVNSIINTNMNYDKNDGQIFLFA